MTSEETSFNSVLWDGFVRSFWVLSGVLAEYIVFSVMGRFGDDIQAFVGENTIFAAVVIGHGDETCPQAFRKGLSEKEWATARVAPAFQNTADLARELLKSSDYCTIWREVL